MDSWIFWALDYLNLPITWSILLVPWQKNKEEFLNFQFFQIIGGLKVRSCVTLRPLIRQDNEKKLVDKIS